MLGDSLSMTSWARGLLNLTMSMHRKEQTITMLFTESFLLALMCSDFGFVHETKIFSFAVGFFFPRLYVFVYIGKEKLVIVFAVCRLGFLISSNRGILTTRTLCFLSVCNLVSLVSCSCSLLP